MRTTAVDVGTGILEANDVSLDAAEQAVFERLASDVVASRDAQSSAIARLEAQLSPLRTAKAALDGGQLTVAQLNQVAKALVKAAIVVVRVLIWQTKGGAVPAAQPGDNGT